MHQQEKSIRDKRIIEATKKNFMGVSGKLGQIVKWLGMPIMQQRGLDATYLDDPFAIEEEIPTMDEDEGIIKLGMFFDGLSRGMHLEIRYMYGEKALTVTYKGYRVYTEINGFLESYVPFPEWENHIENLYKYVKTKTKKAKREEDPSVKKKLQSFVKNLKERWGF